MNKNYNRYKETNYDNIGTVPEHWEIKKIKHISNIYGRIGFRGYTVNDIVDFRDGAISLSPSNIVDDKLIIKENDTYISWFKYDESPEIKVFKEDIIFVKTASVGKVAIVDKDIGPATLNPQLIVFKNVKINKKFFYYLLASNVIKTQVQQGLFGGVVGTLSQEKINNYYIPLPPMEEQRKVVYFLDALCYKIDYLIDKKKQQILTLKQYRKSLISETVTCGLKPNVKMKDSGIEWMGQVPDHWDLISVRNLIRQGKLEIQDGNHGEIHPTSEDYVKLGIPFLMANNIRKGKIDFENCKYISEETAQKLRIGFSKVNDLLFTHKGTVGEVSIVQDNEFPFLMLTPQITYYRFKDDTFLNKFIYYFFQSKSFENQRRLISSMQSTRDYIGLIAQKEFIFPKLKIEEQKNIVEFLDEKTKGIDNAISLIEQQILTLKHYCQSLIYEAVTGKIDVRNYKESDLEVKI